jgi:hypothetical protein
MDGGPIRSAEYQSAARVLGRKRLGSVAIMRVRIQAVIESDDGHLRGYFGFVRIVLKNISRAGHILPAI